MLSFPLEQVNRFCLSKQHLTSWSVHSDVCEVIRDLTCLQAGSAMTPYLSLWSRVRNFTPDALVKELYQSKRLVKVKCMRGELFILPLEMLEAAVVATQEQFLTAEMARTYHSMARVMSKTKGETNPFEGSEYELDEYRDSIVRILEHECLTIEQLKKRLATNINISNLVYALCDARVLARGATVRWDNNKHHYTAWRNWLPELSPRISKDEAQAVLVKSYIKSYGPVCLEDIVWWTGFSKEDTARQMRNIHSEITEITINCFEGKYYLSNDLLPRLKSTRYLDEPTVNLLPSQDTYVVAYRRRTRHSPRDIYHKIHDRAGNVLPVILIDGQVEGVWDFGANQVEYMLFEKLDGITEYEIKQKARSLTDFLRAHL